MSLNIQEIVNVSASIVAQGVLRREFGIPILLTRDETMPLGAARVMKFADQDAVAEVFPADSDPYAAGNIYFQQEPFPKNLMVGRVNLDADAPAALFGGTVASLAAFQAIADGGFSLSVDSGEYADIAALDFSGAVSYADVAGIIDAKLTADGIAAGCEFVEPTNGKAGYMKLTGSAAGSGKSLSPASSPAAGTDISALLGWTLASGVTVQDGLDRESVTEALNALQELNGQFYFVTTDTTFTDEEKAEADAWVASRSYMAFQDSDDPQLLITGETVSYFSKAAELSLQRTLGVFSRTQDFKALSAAGRLGSTDFSARNSQITLKFKELPGTLADDLSTTQKTELDRKRVNVYTPFSGDDIFVEGYTFKAGVFADVRYFVDWFIDAARIEIYNLLRQIPTKIAQTEGGMTALVNAVTSVCRQAVRNGGVAPGQLSAAMTKDVIDTTGNTDFDGYLTNGYLVFANPISEQSQSDRNERKAPQIKVWLKGSGAIHFADVATLFEN